MFNIFKKSKIKKMNGKDVMEFIKNEKDLVIIDIRTSMEFMQGSIKNSKNIDFYHPSFLSKIKKLDKNRKYLIYCASGSRSKAACRLLERLNFQYIYDLKGGFSSYINNK
ncbi:MAG: rhodanese-like domain-containing protein [Fusobacteriaceae bacterium]|nr:rhodanese-like domain-containing protein [Fusobacteriaceae bacterium]